MLVEEYGSDSSDIIYPVKRRRVYDSPEEDESEWYDPRGNQPKIVPFTKPSGFVSDTVPVSSDVAVQTCYELLVPDELFEEIAKQTNLYATQQLKAGSTQRLAKWTATDKNEMKRFFGLILWMGLVRLPAIHLYWSSDPAYMQTYPKKIMSRNRFELLLRMLHFVDNKKGSGSNRLFKIQPVLDTLDANYRKYYNPTEDICIDESVIPFRGRILIKNYLRQHKFVIKIHKLCCGSGYTYTFRVDAGNSLQEEIITPTRLVMSLCKDVFGKGHTLYTNTSYTSVDLAGRLIAKKTHLVGTLLATRRGNPREVITKKLKRGEIMAKENDLGVTVLKWKDSRDILVLSTKHSSEVVIVEGRTEHKVKPRIIVDYNRGKAAAGLSDQTNAYSVPHRRSVKWYRKLAFELLLNTTVINSYILYKDITKKTISVTEFRKKLAVHLTSCREEGAAAAAAAAAAVVVVPQRTIPLAKKQRHKHQKTPGKASEVRKYCKSCYEKNATEFGRTAARKMTKRVVTFCDTCQGQPFLCLPCFNEIH